MKFSLTDKANKNYVGSVVKITHLRKHTNANNLAIATIFGNSVVVGLDVAIGDYGMFFPLESQLQPVFLKKYNLYRNETLNDDVNKKGFFEENGRVRAVKLRSEKSEGIFIPLDRNDFLPFEGDFNTIDDELVVQKYIIKQTVAQQSKSKGDKKLVKKFDRIAENQFRLHVDTEQLKKNIHKLELDDYIGVHYKKHGTSWVVGNVLTNKVLNWREKLLKYFGFKIQDKEYGPVYSSRKVVKNRYINQDQKNSYYNYDLWNDIHEKLFPIIPKGWTLYGEAIGYLPDGGYIQKPFDYGCKQGEYKIYVYRITITNVDGKVVELDDKQIEEFCEKNSLNYKDTFIFYGTVGELFNNLKTEAQIKYNKSFNPTFWRDDLIDLLVVKYNEKDCYMCVNQVPEEGIVIRKQKLFDYDAFKLKSFRFLEKETKDLDKGEVSIEDEN